MLLALEDTWSRTYGKVFIMKHVMLDLYGCNAKLLANEALLRQVLDEYPARIGMEKVSPIELRDIKRAIPLTMAFLAS